MRELAHMGLPIAGLLFEKEYTKLTVCQLGGGRTVLHWADVECPDCFMAEWRQMADRVGLPKWDNGHRRFTGSSYMQIYMTMCGDVMAVPGLCPRCELIEAAVDANGLSPTRTLTENVVSFLFEMNFWPPRGFRP